MRMGKKGFQIDVNLNVGARQTKVYRKDRVCSRPGCEKKLSVYNPNRECFYHSKMSRWLAQEKMR